MTATGMPMSDICGRTPRTLPDRIPAARFRAGLRLREHLGQRDLAADHLLSYRAKLQIVGASVGAQTLERGVHVDIVISGEDALGLLDRDAAVERGLELVGEQQVPVPRTLLKNADGGHVCERLGDPLLV